VFKSKILKHKGSQSASQRNTKGREPLPGPFLQPQCDWMILKKYCHIISILSGTNEFTETIQATPFFLFFLLNEYKVFHNFI